MALIEATAAGVPVVSTAVGGVAGVVEDGTSGILVAMADDAAVSAAVLAILADRDRAAEMGRHGRARVVARYPADRLVADIERLYTTLLGRP